MVGLGEYLDLIIFYLVFIIVCIFGGVIWYKRRKRINSMTPEEKDKYLRDKAIKTQRKAEKSAARQEALQKHTETAKEVSQKLKDTQEHIHSALPTKCPRCGSKDLQIIGKHRKNFSVGKAVGARSLLVVLALLLALLVRIPKN